MRDTSARGFITCKSFITPTALLLCLAASQMMAQTSYTVTDIGVVDNSNDHVSGASALNNGGMVVGQKILPSGPDRAFLWRRGTVLDIGTLGGLESGSASINANGQVVGVADTAAGSEHAFSWEHGRIVDLLTLGGDSSEANHVNARGEIVGFSATTTLDPTQTTGPHESHAFFCETAAICAAGGMKDLLTLGGPNSIAIGNNSKGVIVGWSQIDFNIGDFNQPDLHAVIWKDGEITPLEGLGGAITLAIGVNDEGTAVGQSFLAGNPTLHAVMWQHGGLTDLGTLPGDAGSSASGINNRGEVVGASFSATSRAFVWRNGVMTDLNTRIPANSGWTLDSANGVNDAGQIVGNGHLYGSPHAFLLTPCAEVGRTGSFHALPANALSDTARMWLIWGKSGLLRRTPGR